MGPNDKQNAGVLSVAILNDKLNGVLAVDPAAHTMTVGAGMDMNQLFKHATDNKMSVQVRPGGGDGACLGAHASRACFQGRALAAPCRCGRAGLLLCLLPSPQRSRAQRLPQNPPPQN
jgi:hypothetical protein